LLRGKKKFAGGVGGRVKTGNVLELDRGAARGQGGKPHPKKRRHQKHGVKNKHKPGATGLEDWMDREHSGHRHVAVRKQDNIKARNKQDV